MIVLHIQNEDGLQQCAKYVYCMCIVYASIYGSSVLIFIPEREGNHWIWLSMIT